MGACRICGAPHKSCGPASTVTPVDQDIPTIQGGSMALKEYEVTIDGRHPHKTSMLLSDEDAKRMGLLEPKAARRPANKARAPRNKAAKPAAKRAPAAKPADDASDPDASE